MNNWIINADTLRELCESEDAREERREIMARDEAYTSERDCAKIEQAVVVAYSAIMRDSFAAAMKQKSDANGHIEINLGANFHPAQTLDTLFTDLLERKLKRECFEAEIRYVDFEPRYFLHETQYILHFNYRISW